MPSPLLNSYLATEICEYAPAVVPGLLQTPEYARAVFLASNPLAVDEYIEELLRGRMGRTQLLKEATRPMYWAVLHETALRIPVGDMGVMARQLDHVAALMRDRKVLVQVLPFAAGAHPWMGKMMKLMEFEDAPPTVYTEGVRSANLLDDPTVVRKVQASYDLLRATALSRNASLTLIESAAEDYRRCANTT